MCDKLNVTGLDSELERIVNGCLNNDRLCQKQLYDRYASRMFVVCRRYASSAAEAEDMLMEGFMNVFRNLHSFKGDSKFDTWVYSVMVKTSISHYRSVRKFRNEQFSEDLDETVAWEEENTFVANMDARRVLDLMEKMQTTPRMVFNLKEVEGYDFKEIAELLGKKESAVRVAYMRARKWLQDTIS